MRTRVMIAVLGLSTLVIPSVVVSAGCYYYSWSPGCTSDTCTEGMGSIWIGTGEDECTCESPTGAHETCDTYLDDGTVCWREYDLDPDCENLKFDCEWGQPTCWSP